MHTLDSIFDHLFIIVSLAEILNRFFVRVMMLQASAKKSRFSSYSKYFVIQRFPQLVALETLHNMS